MICTHVKEKLYQPCVHVQLIIEMARRVSGMEETCSKIETLKSENQKLLQRKEQLEEALKTQQIFINKQNSGKPLLLYFSHLL